MVELNLPECLLIGKNAFAVVPEGKLHLWAFCDLHIKASITTKFTLQFELEDNDLIAGTRSFKSTVMRCRDCREMYRASDQYDSNTNTLFTPVFSLPPSVRDQMIRRAMHRQCSRSSSKVGMNYLRVKSTSPCARHLSATTRAQAQRDMRWRGSVKMSQAEMRACPFPFPSSITKPSTPQHRPLRSRRFPPSPFRIILSLHIILLLPLCRNSARMP